MRIVKAEEGEGVDRIEDGVGTEEEAGEGEEVGNEFEGPRVPEARHCGCNDGTVVLMVLLKSNAFCANLEVIDQLRGEWQVTCGRRPIYSSMNCSFSERFVTGHASGQVAKRLILVRLISSTSLDYGVFDIVLDT